MKTRNNFLVLGGIVFLVFLAAIPMSWFTVSVAVKEFKGEIIPVLVKGWDGALLGTLPIWFLLSLASCAVLIVLLNAAGVTTISRKVSLALLAICGACFVTPLFQGERFEVHAGMVVALVNCLAAIALVLFSPMVRVQE